MGKTCRKCKVRVSPGEARGRGRTAPPSPGGNKERGAAGLLLQVNEPVQVELDSVGEATKDGFGGQERDTAINPGRKSPGKYPWLDPQSGGYPKRFKRY